MLNPLADEYDFVVVGAGSAGCALAGRLSEDPSIAVAVVEAGGSPEGDMFRVPALWGQQFTTTYDWDYVSEPEPYLDARRTFLPRGKVLGGTSAMNGMIYIRGAAADFDEWSMLGCRGWSWREVLPYFMRAECNMRGASALHGASGPLHVSDRLSDNPLTEAWVTAARDAGFPLIEDFNGVNREGVGFYQFTHRDGERSSAHTAYLEPVAGRPNLRLVSYAQAHRLLIEGDRAVGVEIDRCGQVSSIRAAREVIVCAGAYNTPQLLMLSGIGPSEHLGELGIPVRADLPVGDNLQDHPGVALVVATSGPSTFGIGTEADWSLYREQRRGPLSSNVVEAGGFFRTSRDEPECDAQAIVMPAMFLQGGRGAVTRHAFTASVQLTRPASAGTVRLRSLARGAKPRILHNHMASPVDRVRLARAVGMQLEIFDHSPLAERAGERLTWPASRSEQSIGEFITREALGQFHPVGTCAMGRVVDHELRVHGIDGLRVADASVMPTIVRGNPNAATIMVGEKASDIINGRQLPPAPLRDEALDNRLDAQASPRVTR